MAGAMRVTGAMEVADAIGAMEVADAIGAIEAMGAAGAAGARRGTMAIVVRGRPGQGSACS